MLTYDATFEGFLTVVFEIYEQQLLAPIINRNSNLEHQLFGTQNTIYTNTDKAHRVWKGMKTYLGVQGCRTLYYAFLSELNGIENTMLKVLQYTFSTKKNTLTNYANPDVLALSKIVKKVQREKHRMEAFVRFQETKDGVFFANITPDFDVLPLINKHFTNRYADQKWIIYDLKRSYGLFYNLEQTTNITIDFNTAAADRFTAAETEYQTLWKDYFKSTNIEERVNRSLHIKHVPKRYWKYLSEKQ
jgi:probable DNA metabolism protein